MKNGKVDIEVFEILDSIFESNRGSLTIEDWAEAAGYQKPRISELRNILKIKRGEPVKKEIKDRAVTIEKITRLYTGLTKLIGGKIVNKELMEKLDKLDNSKDRCLLLILTLSEKTTDRLEEVLRGAAKAEIFTEPK